MRLTARHQSPFEPYDQEVGYGLINAQGALNFVGPSKTVAHWEIGDGPFSVGPLSVQDSAKVHVEFVGVTGLNAAGSYTTWCYRYRLDGYASFPFPFATTPNVWVRASGTLGWRDTTIYNDQF